MKSTSIFTLLSAFPLSTWSFQSTLQMQRHRLAPLPRMSTTAMEAKMKKTRSSGGEGFAKSPSSSSSVSSPSNDDDAIPAFAPRALQSIEPNDSIPSFQPPTKASSNIQLDPSLPPEERSQQLLRQKYNLKSYEEQQGDIRKVIQSEEKKRQRDKLRNIEKLWPADKDLFAVLPPEILRGIDAFLKVGLGICTVLFVSAGVFITIEAGSKATGKELPVGLEEFVVNVVEPNFTPGLGVLLAFSVGLGLFSSAQLGSAGSTYREEP
mmetsp:Transcript_19582/g.38710  ORF Transcript_19582/g.38710 Transcript_19582/m.38710 type:complete len:265 (+) Transcript_19582:59-853(+)